MKKKNLIIALAAILVVCIAVVVCFVVFGTSSNNTNNNDVDTEQTITDATTNPGNENSDHDNNDTVVDSTVDTDSDVDDSDSTSGSEDVEDDNTSNNTENNDDVTEVVPDDSDDTINDENDTDNPAITNPYAEPVVIGFAVYVCEAGQTLPYANGQRINGVETTLDDSRVMYSFGDYEVMYIAGVEKGEITSGLGKGEYFTLHCDFSDNLVYCYSKINKRSDGTYSASMSAYYVNMSRKSLVYYTAPVYRHNDDVFLVTNSISKQFKNNEMALSTEPVMVYIDDVAVEVYTYVEFMTEMYDGLYNGFEIVFYNSSNEVIGSNVYTNGNLPDEIVWSAGAYTAQINLQYDGVTLMTITRNRRNIEKSNTGYDWDTVINDVCYHHHISWVLVTE